MRSRSRIVSSPNFQKSFSNADEGEEGVGFEMLLPRLLLSPSLPIRMQGKSRGRGKGGEAEREIFGSHIKREMEGGREGPSGKAFSDESEKRGRGKEG